MSYPSRYGASRPLSAGQALAELACERQATAQGLVLPDRFWAQARWARAYRAQAAHAAALIKAASAEAVFRALRAPEGRRVLSLAAPWFLPLVLAEDEAIRRQAAAPPPPPPPPAPAGAPFRRPAPRKNLLSRLEDA